VAFHEENPFVPFQLYSYLTAPVEGEKGCSFSTVLGYALAYVQGQFEAIDEPTSEDQARFLPLIDTLEHMSRLAKGLTWSVPDVRFEAEVQAPPVPNPGRPPLEQTIPLPIRKKTAQVQTVPQPSTGITASLHPVKKKQKQVQTLKFGAPKKRSFAVQTTTASQVEQEGLDIEFVGGNGDRATDYATRWHCCGKTVEGDGDEETDGRCFEGYHTTDVRDARYRADDNMSDEEESKPKSCAALSCRGPHMQHKTSTKRRRVERDIDSDDDVASGGASKPKILRTTKDGTSNAVSTSG